MGESNDVPRAAWRGKRSQGAVLLRLCGGVTFWHDRSGEPYASVSEDGCLRHLEVRASPFREWLARSYFTECGGAPSGGALNDAVAYASARGAYCADARDVFLRVGTDEGAILLDLCDGSGAAARISPAGVTVDAEVRTAFRRSPSACALPRPVAGGSVCDVRRFVNVSDDDWPLVAAWLLATVRPTGPFPVLFLHGEQGTGKSTQARVLRSLVDPNFAPLRAAPRDAHDLAIASHHNWVLALDNLSSIPVWLSDAFCRLSTGGGFATRSLYANDRETVFQAQRPVLVTGIEDLATRGDLIDRSIIVHLPILSASARRAESDLWREFEVQRPALFGALCAAASEALATSCATDAAKLPRLADFALWARRGASAFGSSPDDFSRLYARALAEHSVAAVESSALARPLVRLALAGEWRGTAADLVYAVETLAGRSGVRAAGWPRSSIQFAGALRRLAPSLRSVGVSVDFRREPGSGRRVITLSVTDAALAIAQRWDAAPGARPCQLGLLDPLAGTNPPKEDVTM